MLDDKEILLDILCEILGDPEKIYDSKLQYGYNCPECGLGERKGNLEVSLEKHLFHCWACGDVNETHGTLGKLIDKYGNKKQKKVYNLLQPEVQKPKEKQKNKLKLPENFVRFKDSNPRYPIRQQAYNYLKNRGITDEIIEKYGIGFCDKGSFSGRIIIPSYDSKNQLNYFIARSWNPNSRAKYKNPESAKDDIIFFENMINWDKDIYLCEGVFDAIFLPNSIPMLGKHMSELLFETIYSKTKKNIIISLDGDAWDNSVKLYEELNGGELYNRVKIVKLPKDKDVCDLRGQIDEYYYEMK